jgi:hypothetical protein
MSRDLIERWRRWAGIAGSIFCLLSLLAVIDALVARFREPPGLFQMLPGTNLEIQGPLREAVDSPARLSFQCDSRDIRLVFEGVQTGYWMGGYLWRGRLIIGPETRAGLYSLRVLGPGKAATPGFPPFQIRVFEDPETYRRNLPSLIQRYAGVAPWLAAVFAFIPAMGFFILVFFLSQKIDRLLAQEGKAEIYRVRQTELGLEISFGLGRDQGLEEGSRLNLFDEKGRSLGTVEVRSVTAGDAVALASEEQSVRPGYWLAKFS